MAQEYRLEEVLLSLEDNENVLESLLNQRGTLESFEYYNNNPKDIVDVIVKANDDIRKKYIQGIISIYPLSAGMLNKLMESYDMQSMREDVFYWLDVSDAISEMVTKFTTICSEGLKESKEESDLEEQIELLEKKKKGLEKQRKINKENKEKLKDKRREVDKLQAECEEMRNKYSPEILDAEEKKLKTEKAKLIKEKEEYDKKLKALEKELEPYRNSGNKDFDKAMKAFSEVIKTLPHDEG